MTELALLCAAVLMASVVNAATSETTRGEQQQRFKMLREEVQG